MTRRPLPAVSERPVVAICGGKDCRKRCEFTKVRTMLDEQCDVVELRCVGLCNGPVVIVDPRSDAPAVYARLRTKRQRKLIVAAALGVRGAARDLSSRRVGKKKVAERVARQARRRLPAA